MSLKIMVMQIRASNMFSAGVWTARPTLLNIATSLANYLCHQAGGTVHFFQRNSDKLLLNLQKPSQQADKFTAGNAIFIWSCDRVVNSSRQLANFTFLPLCACYFHKILTTFVLMLKNTWQGVSVNIYKINKRYIDTRNIYKPDAIWATTQPSRRMSS